MSKYDIDHLPTSETGKRMLRRVAPVYENSYFMKCMCQAMGLEWDEARELMLSLREQAFTETVTWGIEYQEHKYSIVPDESLSLEERRARLKRRTQQKFPLNPGILEQYIKNGWDLDVDVDETVAPGYIKLTFDDGMTESIGDVIADIRRIKPSHLSIHAALEIEKALPFPLAFALPASNVRSVETEPVKEGIGSPLELALLSVDPHKGIREGIPDATDASLFLNLLHSPLFSRSVGTREEHIDIPDRMGGEELSLFHGMMLWEPPSAIHTKLPQNGTAGLFMSIRTSPVMEKAAKAALPRRETQCGLSISLLASPLLPRHVKAAALPEPIHWEPPEGGTLAHHAGFLAGGIQRGIGMAMPKGATARQTVGILAGEILPRHVRERNDGH